MTRSRRLPPAALALFAMFAVIAAPAVAVAADAVDATIDAFAKSVEADTSLDAAKRDAVLAQIARQRGDELARRDTITDALRLLHPPFAQALEALSGDEPAGAEAALSELAKSKEPYLAAHARFYLARAHTFAERYEQAEPLLAEVTGPAADRTLYTGDALFLLGVCQNELLKHDEARKTLSQFIEQHPEAPERMRVGAMQIMQEMDIFAAGSLLEVHDRMDFARRRLALADPGKTTQNQQEKVITLLDKLIKEAEEKEKQGGGGGGGGGNGNGPPSGNNQPSSPATESTAPVGETRIGALHRVNRGDAADTWGNMPKKQRDAVLAALKARFPDRYKELVEQYFKSLQDEKK